MTFTVRWADHLTQKITAHFRSRHTPPGQPGEDDFVCGPLAAATQQFVHFDRQPMAAGPAVRSVHVLDPVLGPVVFIGVLVDRTVVEIADFEVDPDYWSLIENDPEG